MNVLPQQNKPEYTEQVEGRLRFYRYGMIVAVIAALISMSKHYWLNDIQGTVLNLMIALFASVIVLMIRIRENVITAGKMILLFIGFVMLVNIWRLELDPNGIFWLVLYPIAAFMVKGPKAGLRHSGIYILSISILFIFRDNPLDLNTLLNFYLLLTALILTTYFYESTRTKWKSKLEEALIQSESQKELLRTMAIRDDLTGLYNRRFFNEVFPRELTRLQNSTDVVGFFILDVDYFKRYNDNYGHQAGDTVLRQVSSTLLEEFQKKGDYLFRLGGEEFGGIIHGRNDEEVIEKINHIGKAVEKKRITHEYSDISDVLTVSVGAILTDSERTFTEDSIYKQADEALYHAKETGRDRVVIVDR